MKIFILILVISCSSSKLIVKTKQEKASVSYFDRDTLTYQVLGETPLVIDPKKSKLSKAQINQIAVLRVDKPGYVSESILVTGDRLKNTEIILDLKQNSQWFEKDSSSVSKMAEKIAQDLFTVNKSTANKDYGTALKAVNTLIDSYPEVSMFYDIKGSLHLLKNEKELARQSFKKSIELKPGNIKTKQLLEQLKN